MEPAETLALEEIDLSDLDFWALPADVRDGAFKTLRRERPISRFDEPDLRDRSTLAPPPGPGFWAVTRHRDITEVSRQPEIFRSGQGAISVLDLPPEMLDYFGGMISTDNPRHARLRRIVSTAFSPKMIRATENDIGQVATDVVTEVQPRGECDFAVDVAAQLPLRVICRMMGIPASEHERVLRCSNIILSNGDPELVPADADPVVAFLTAAQELVALMHDLGEHRLAHPTDDLTSALVNTNIDGEALTGQELSSFFVELVVAGNETTRTAIVHGLWALTEHPDQRDLWRDRFDEVSATAADEIVRWASPVTWMRRTVAEPTVLSGHPLEAGDKLLLFYNSANRDDDVFDEPFRFDLRRSPNPHVGFGSAGPHFCLGAHLARREITVMFRELFARLPDIEATGEPDRLRSDFLNGIKHLGCAFTPTGQE
ncbi:MAG TPA: cytochrome P450 [Acidimicrobiales bacterium]|nr:cytochrome P450 [Acidimicrobiales bacterium]